MRYDVGVDIGSFYIHWPFCFDNCLFCCSACPLALDGYMNRYVDALCKEIKTFADQFRKKQHIETLYIGGGVPDRWETDSLLDTFGTLKSVFEIRDSAEITIEVNLETVVQSHFNAWVSAGINRLSINMYRFDEQGHYLLDYRQLTQGVKKIIGWIEGKFKTVSIDLIIGLPGITEQEWKQLIEKVVNWPIQHVSLSFLTSHEPISVSLKPRKKDTMILSSDNTVDIYRTLARKLRRAGFHQYEVSQFARLGHESKHNHVYWKRDPYKGFGASACSFDGTHRFQNEKNIAKYIQKIEQGEDATDFFELLDCDAVRLERLMLGLRTVQVIALGTCMQGLSLEQQKEMGRRLMRLEGSGLIKRVDDHITLTSRAMLVEQEIVAHLSL